MKTKPAAKKQNTTKQKPQPTKQKKQEKPEKVFKKTKPKYTVHCWLTGEKIATASGRKKAEVMAVAAGAKHLIIKNAGTLMRGFVSPNNPFIKDNVLVHVTSESEPPDRMDGFKIVHVATELPLKEQNKIVKMISKTLHHIKAKSVVTNAVVSALFVNSETEDLLPFLLDETESAPMIMMASQFDEAEGTDVSETGAELLAIVKDLTGGNVVGPLNPNNLLELKDEADENVTTTQAVKP